MLRITLILWLSMVSFNGVSSQQNTNCPTTSADLFNRFYIADNTNRCIYYWCANGVLLGQFQCPPGMGTQAGINAATSICTVTLAACGGTVPTPATVSPTTVVPTVTTTVAPVVTTPIQTLTGMHLPAGSQQTTFITLATCQAACVTQATCFGVDFDTNGNMCYFHTATSICLPPMAKSTCTHYQYRLCQRPTGPPVLPTTTATPVTPSQIFDTQNGMNVGGGTRQPDIRDVSTCIAQCVANPTTCSGVDFDTRDTTCWFHSSTTVCNPLRAKGGCNHYKLTLECFVTTTPVKAATCTATAGMKYSTGGTAQAATVNTEALCNTACIDALSCTAYDYDTVNNVCTLYTQTDTCAMLEANANFNLCLFITCPTVPILFPNTHALQGTLQVYRDATTCQAKCILATATCVAYDFDSSTNSCWFHTSTTCVNRLTKDSCTHVQVQACP